VISEKADDINTPMAAAPAADKDGLPPDAAADAEGGRLVPLAVLTSAISASPGSAAANLKGLGSSYRQLLSAPFAMNRTLPVFPGAVTVLGCAPFEEDPAGAGSSSPLAASPAHAIQERQASIYRQRPAKSEFLPTACFSKGTLV